MYKLKSYLLRYKNFYSLGLIFLLLFGFYLRIHNLSNEPYWIDEGYTINGILAIQEHGDLTLDSGEEYRCPIYCRATNYITQIFGNNAFSYRLLSVIAGTLLILVVYIITKKFINEKVALLSSFFITFAHYEIAWSRQARWYALFSLFFLLTIYFFYKAYRERKIKFYILALISFLITFYLQPISIILPVVFVLF